MKRESTAQLIVVVILLLLPVLYVGSYLALVTPVPVNVLSYSYRFGGAWSARVFWPMEQIDRKLRPETWRDRRFEGIVNPAIQE